MSLTDLEKARLVARVENQTGHYVVDVEEVALLPSVAGTCACGNHIEAFICVQWCDACFDEFDRLIAENHADPFEGPRTRWRANGWKDASPRTSGGHLTNGALT